MIACAQLAWRQLNQQPARLLVAVLGVVFAVVLMLMQLGFRAALFQSAVRLHRALKAEVVVVSKESVYLLRVRSFPRRRLEQALGIPGVAAVAPILTGPALIHDSETGTLGLLAVGFRPGDDVLELPGVQEREALLKRPDHVLLDEASRPEYRPILERIRRSPEPVELELNDRRIRVAGLFRLGTSFGVDSTALMSDVTFLSIFDARTPGLIELGLVRVVPGADPAAVRDELRRRLPADVSVLLREELAQRDMGYWGRVTPIGYILGFGVIMGFVVGAIIVSQILFADVTDHLPEYATLKAIGYGTPFLFGVVFFEAVFLAVLGYVPGLLLSMRLFTLARNATQLPLLMTRSSNLFVFALTLTMCVIAGALAMRKVQSADPAEIF